MNKNLIQKNYKGFLVVLLSFLFLVGWASWRENRKETREILSFEECIMSYASIPTRPAKCWTPEGDLFIDYTFDDSRLIIDTEKEWIVENNTLAISGQVDRALFYEASFIAELWDSLGQKFSWGIAGAQDSNWMTLDLVPFRVYFKLPNYYSEDRATLVLIKDTAGGPLGHGDVLAVPIKLIHRVLPE